MEISTLLVFPLQDWINRVFGIDNNASTTILITITVFILGFFINWLANSISKFFKRGNVRTIFNTSLRTIIESLEKQSEHFIEFSETLNVENKDVAFSLKRKTINNLEIIERIDYIVLYNSFFTGIENIRLRKDKVKRFAKISGIIGSIKDTEEDYPNEVKEFINRFNQDEDKRNPFLDGFRREWDRINAETQDKELPKRLADYLMAVDGTMLNWQNMENRTHYHIAQEHLVIPLIKINSNILNEQIETPTDLDSKIKHLALNLQNNLLGASLHYENLKNTLYVYSEIFKFYSELYNREAKNLKEWL